MSFVIYREGHVTDLDLFSTFMSMDHKTRLSPIRVRGQLTGKLVISRNLEHKTYLECNHCFNVFIGSPESQFSRTIESGRVGLLSDLSSGSVLMCTVGGEAGAGL